PPDMMGHHRYAASFMLQLGDNRGWFPRVRPPWRSHRRTNHDDDKQQREVRFLHQLKGRNRGLPIPCCRWHRPVSSSGWERLSDEWRSEEHTSELQSRFDLVCRLLLEKKKTKYNIHVRIIYVGW